MARVTRRAAVALALLAAACGPSPATPPDPPGTAGTAEEAAEPCGPLEHPPVQGGQHLVGDTTPPVPYSSTPPTSGWHASGRFDIAVQPPDDPLSEPQQVSVLEAGGVVISYHALPAGARERLEGFVRDRYPGRVAVTPYDRLPPGGIALTAWGVLQRCDGVDLSAVAAFVDAHADPAPRPPGVH